MIKFKTVPPEDVAGKNLMRTVSSLLHEIRSNYVGNIKFRYKDCCIIFTRDSSSRQTVEH